MAFQPPNSRLQSRYHAVAMAAAMHACMHAEPALRRVDLRTFKAGDGWEFGLEAAIDAADGEQVRRVDGPQEKADQCLT